MQQKFDKEEFIAKTGLTEGNFYNHQSRGNIGKKSYYVQADIDRFLKNVKQRKPKLDDGEFNRTQFAEKIGIKVKGIAALIASKRIENKLKYTQADVDKYKEEFGWAVFAKPDLSKEELRELTTLKTPNKARPTVGFEVITVDEAKKILSKNARNRNVNIRNINNLTMAMETGDYMQIGDTIRIAQNGRLLDGQHRLLAIIKTKMPQEVIVVRDLDNDAFKYIDTGRNRTAGDVLSIEGIADASKIAAVVKFIINFKRGYFAAAAKGGATDRNTRISNADVSRYVSRHKTALHESAAYGYAKENKLISGSILSGLHYCFDEIDSVKADKFCHSFVQGTDLKKGDPIYEVRERLIGDSRSVHKMNSVMKAALICKAWNFYRQNKTGLRVIWDQKREDFPKPI